MAKPQKHLIAAISAALIATLLGTATLAPAMADDLAPVTGEPQVSASPSPTESVVATPVRSVNAAKIFSSRSRQAINKARELAPHSYVGYYRTSKYAKWYAKRHIYHTYGWGDKQYKCLVTLWQKESSWRPSSVMPGYRFLGIPQLSRQNIVGAGYTVSEFRSSTELQIQLGAKYIKYRKGYGNPCKALKHFKKRHWY